MSLDKELRRNIYAIKMYESMRTYTLILFGNDIVISIKNQNGPVITGINGAVQLLFHFSNLK